MLFNIPSIENIMGIDDITFQSEPMELKPKKFFKHHFHECIEELYAKFKDETSVPK